MDFARKIEKALLEENPAAAKFGRRGRAENPASSPSDESSGSSDTKVKKKERATSNLAEKDEPPKTSLQRRASKEEQLAVIGTGFAQIKNRLGNIAANAQSLL